MDRLLEWINSHPLVHIDFHHGVLFSWANIKFDNGPRYDIKNELFDRHVFTKSICIHESIDEDEFFNMLDNLYDAVMSKEN